MANSLLTHAHGIDTLGDWYDLVKQANPETWDELKGDTLAAMDCRVAAEVLLRALDDLGRRDLRHRHPAVGEWSVRRSTIVSYQIEGSWMRSSLREASRRNHRFSLPSKAKRKCC